MSGQFIFRMGDFHFQSLMLFLKCKDSYLKWTVFQTTSFTKAKATKADACKEELSFFYYRTQSAVTDIPYFLQYGKDRQQKSPVLFSLQTLDNVKYMYNLWVEKNP